jgi:hypothetical protein
MPAAAPGVKAKAAVTPPQAGKLAPAPMPTNPCPLTPSPQAPTHAPHSFSDGAVAAKRLQKVNLG